jgi:hypothetical protein
MVNRNRSQSPAATLAMQRQDDQGRYLTAYMVKTGPAAANANAKPGAAKAQPAVAKPGAPNAPGGVPGQVEDQPGRHGPRGCHQRQNTGRGDFAVYNAVTGISTLIGNVVLTRGSDVMRGQSAVMDMNNNVSRILPSAGVPGGPTQRVQGLFVREDVNNATGTGQKTAPAVPPGKKP